MSDGSLGICPRSRFAKVTICNAGNRPNSVSIVGCDAASASIPLVGSDFIREATGTLTKPGRPPIGDKPKQQVTLRPPADVIAHFKAGGAGWQTRIGEVLKHYADERSSKSA